MRKLQPDDKTKIKTINEKVLAAVAAELNLPIKLVRDVVVNGQSKFTAHTMASNTFDGVRWLYFGVFKAKHKVVQVLSHMKGLDAEQKQFFKEMLKMQRKEKKEAVIAAKQAEKAAKKKNL